MSDDRNPIRILAVDDHPLQRQGVASLIADEPYMTLVAKAANGREAIEQFRRHRPDITLMDVQMPEMNGSDRKANLVFRWEIFKLLNRPNFADPASDVSSPGTFGKITALSVNPRIMQFGLKMEF